MVAAVRNHVTAHQLQSSRNNPWQLDHAAVRGDGARAYWLTVDNQMTVPRPRGCGPQWRPVRARGISLIEMMVTLSIVAILAVVATPSFTGIIQKARLQTEANSLVNDLQFARSEAVKRGQPVSLCPSSDGATCDTTHPNAWEQGWIVFNDVNGSGSLDSTNDTPLRVRSALTNGDTFTPSPAASAVTYSRDGFATNLSNGTVTMKLRTSPVNNDATRCVEINMAGRQAVLTPGVRQCS